MYKVGDKIIFINSGKIYMITEMSISTCRINHLSNPGYWWDLTLFEPYNYREEKLKKILCK